MLQTRCWPMPKLLPFCNFVAPANIFNSKGHDPRAPVDLKIEKNLQAIGRLGGTTAFLVSPCYILTAAHSVGAENVVFEVPQPSSRGARLTFTTVQAVPVARGKGNDIRDDWALLKLSTCVGGSVGWLELANPNDPVPFNEPIAIAGYPNDMLKDQLWRDETGFISRGLPDTDLGDCLLNSAATRGGNSGSPLFIVNADGPRVLGLQVRATNPSRDILRAYSYNRANIAIDARHIRTEIEQFISPDKQTFWSEHPELKGKNPAVGSVP
jgi:V8-like Glu-specific endopeptidase